jgi:hypothetical protein
MCALGAKFASRQKDGAGRAADFPDAEDELYLRVLRRRIDHGYPVNHWWLKMEFRAILNETTPPGHNNFKCSSGWAVRFCVRYRLSLQAANNIKAHDQVDRVEAIRSFHRYWLHKVQNSQPQSDPKYGRFPAKRILHVDQVPLPFASAQKKTLNPINFGSCRIAGPNMSGLEKRQATLQLWIVADAEHQYVKPSLIFRGSTGPKSKLPWPEEKALYDTLPDIRVYFQKNAWADEEFCLNNIFDVARDIADAGVEVAEIAIGMDNHSSQRTPEMMRVYSSLGFFPLFTAANCTDCISPVDHHVGSFIQSHMARSYRAEVENNPAIWMASADEIEVGDADCRAAMSRRMLMAKWLSAAWDDLVNNHTGLLHNAFVHTGFLVAKDGSEDSLMQIQGWKGTEPYGGFRDN